MFWKKNSNQFVLFENHDCEATDLNILGQTQLKSSVMEWFGTICVFSKTIKSFKNTGCNHAGKGELHPPILSENGGFSRLVSVFIVFFFLDGGGGGQNVFSV